eukprot:Skav222086  [mRNA]  locus=scaffold2165:103869:105722:- [translate_table: standard]
MSDVRLASTAVIPIARCHRFLAALVPGRSCQANHVPLRVETMTILGEGLGTRDLEELSLHIKLQPKWQQRATDTFSDLFGLRYTPVKVGDIVPPNAEGRARSSVGKLPQGS